MSLIEDNIRSQCDDCDYFAYDDVADCYYCELDLDMDDVERLNNSRYNCPYYRFKDEYRIVRKQN